MEGQNFAIASSAIIIFTIMTGAGCAAGPESPFGVYNTPLLEADQRHVYARDRGFNPLDLGDYQTTGSEALAQNGGAKPDVVSTKVVQVEQQSESPQTSAPKRLPSLSTTSATRVGKVKNESGARKVEAKVTGAPADAAEYVWTTYAANGVAFDKPAARSVSNLYKSCKAEGKVSHASHPQIGDIAFFHNTGDFNEDGRNNDWYTLTGLVESIDDAGQMIVLAWMDGQAQRFELNLESESATNDSGDIVNARLRAESAKDAPFTQYFAHELFAGFCGALGDKPELKIIENFEPGR